MSVAADKPSSGSLRRTTLYNLHLALGARMVSFAGYEMPVQYPMGVLREHLYACAAAGLFDVSDRKSSRRWPAKWSRSMKQL